MAKVNFTCDETEADERSPINPGEYKFFVTLAELEIETETLSGSSKWKPADEHPVGEDVDAEFRHRIRLNMSCSKDDGFEFQVFDTLWLTSKAMWKYKQFCKSIGLDPTVPQDTENMENKSGTVRLDRKTGDKYLTPGRYLEPGQTSGQVSTPSEDDPVGNVPF